MVELVEIEPGQEWAVDRMKEEDAPKVAALFISVYGKDYPVKKFIDPELLIAENRSGKTISSVARTTKGDIVGHNAIFHSAPSKVIYESGAGLVHRDYRGGRGIFTEMVRHGEIIIKEQTEGSAIFGEPVCNHVFSQRLCHNMGYTTMAMEVDLMPAAIYSEGATGRVSTLLDFRTVRPRPHKVFLPAFYEDDLRKLYEDLNDEREMAVALGELRDDIKTRIVSENFPFAQVVRMAVHDVGSDLGDRIEAEELLAGKQGTVVFQAWLKLTDPSIGRAVEVMRSKGYFFGGVLPRWFDDDGLLMQKLSAPPHWDDAKIHFDRGKLVMALVRRDWAEITGQGE